MISWLQSLQKIYKPYRKFTNPTESLQNLQKKCKPYRKSYPISSKPIEPPFEPELRLLLTAKGVPEEPLFSLQTLYEKPYRFEARDSLNSRRPCFEQKMLRICADADQSGVRTAAGLQS